MSSPSLTPRIVKVMGPAVLAEPDAAWPNGFLKANLSAGVASLPGEVLASALDLNELAGAVGAPEKIPVIAVWSWAAPTFVVLSAVTGPTCSPTCCSAVLVSEVDACGLLDFERGWGR